MRGILGILLHIVARYANKGNSQWLIVYSRLGKLSVNVLNKGTMVADKHNYGALVTF